MECKEAISVFIYAKIDIALSAAHITESGGASDVCRSTEESVQQHYHAVVQHSLEMTL